MLGAPSWVLRYPTVTTIIYKGMTVDILGMHPQMEIRVSYNE